jgi:DNA adenine methylase
MFSKLNNCWLITNIRNYPNLFNNKKEAFTDMYQKRLEHTSIFCRDALKVIKQTDSYDTFHYIDPPYYNSDMGHYKGYTEDDFIQLLDILSTLKGKFMLSSYPSDVLNEYIKRYEWNTKEFVYSISIESIHHISKNKTEVLTMNYIIS